MTDHVRVSLRFCRIKVIYRVYTNNDTVLTETINSLDIHPLKWMETPLVCGCENTTLHDFDKKSIYHKILEVGLEFFVKM